MHPTKALTRPAPVAGAWSAPGAAAVAGSPQRERWTDPVAGALLLTVATLALWITPGAEPAVSSPPVAAAPWVPPVPAAALPISQAAVPGPAARPEPRSLVQWSGHTLRIDAQATPRRALVAQLAAATGAHLVGDTTALDAAPPVTLRWQGQDGHALWAGLLAGWVGFSAQCQALDCRVWLAGPRPGAALPPPPDPLPAARATQADPPGLFPSD